MLLYLSPMYFALIEDEVIKQGLLGIGVVVLSGVIAKLFAIILKDRDEAFAERKEMTQDLLGRVFPAITKVTEVLENRQSLDQQIVDALGETNALLREIKRDLEFERALRRGVDR